MSDAAATSTDPNAYQVGGSHYQGELQHWDFIEHNRIGYLEGCASKYLMRWEKKSVFPEALVRFAAQLGIDLPHPRQDLQKSLHYVHKIETLRASGVKSPPPLLQIPTDRFLEANPGLGHDEATALKAIFEWRDEADLARAAHSIMILIEAYDERSKRGN